MPLPPPYRITCSCGRTTTIYWTGRRYETTTPGWTCSYPAGWHCTGTAHHQRATGRWEWGIAPLPPPTTITL